MQDIDYLARQERLRTLARERNADAVALVPGANMVYFTGLHYHLSERPTIALVLSGGGMAFISPKLEYSKLQDRLEELDVQEVFTWSDEDGYEGAFQQTAEKLGLRGGVLGVDDVTMRVFEWLAFSAHAPGLHVAGFGQDLLNLRAIKNADEIDAMRQAIKLSEKSLEETLEHIKAGMTEREIATILVSRLQANGSQGLSFDPIVLIGEKSALPHGVVGNRELREGDFLLFDFGGMVNGYPADITRTFVYGTPTDEMSAIYEAVQGANAAARAVVRPGITGDEIDRAAREVIEAAGFGEYFFHRTGHGLGLEVHELPQIAAGETLPLVPGMVFTIEPGIYIVGSGGVRIEDNIVVTEDGSESLTTFPRDMRTLG